MPATEKHRTTHPMMGYHPDSWALLVVLAVAFAGCAVPAPPQPEPAARAAVTTREEPLQARRPPTGRDGLQEQAIGEEATLKPPADTEALLPQLDTSAPPTPAEPESLLAEIGPATAPNVAAALRRIAEGRPLRNQGEHDLALERFERAVAIDPSNAYGYYFLAQLHYLRKNHDQAIAFASRAAVLSARTDRTCLGRVYSLQGAVFEEVGRYPDARKAYRRAIDADPNNLAARVGAARLAHGVAFPVEP
jgi:Flp pilus assembly protein TadD